MKFENTEVWGFKHALRGMRNPLNSWDKSDSKFNEDTRECYFSQRAMEDCCADCKCFNGLNKPCLPLIGKNDMNLAKRLIAGGSEHRKFLRQIMVSVDITAPLYWWKEFDTYKVGTAANSTSTMHKLSTTPITFECFETDDLEDFSIVGEMVIGHIYYLEKLRQKYLETKNKKYWKELIRWLPESWLQTRTVTMNYENLHTMYHQRKDHKLNEWSGKDDSTKPNFITWVKLLPYAKELIVEE